MRKMFETLNRLYRAGSIEAAQLENAVAKGWITEEKMQEILESAPEKGEER